MSKDTIGMRLAQIPTIQGWLYVNIREDIKQGKPLDPVLWATLTEPTYRQALVKLICLQKARQ